MAEGEWRSADAEMCMKIDITGKEVLMEGESLFNLIGRFSSVGISTLFAGKLPNGYDRFSFIQLLTYGSRRGGLSIALFRKLTRKYQRFKVLKFWGGGVILDTVSRRDDYQRSLTI